MSPRHSWLGVAVALGVTAFMGTLAGWMVVPQDQLGAADDGIPGAGWLWCLRLLLAVFVVTCAALGLTDPIGLGRGRVRVLERTALVCGALGLPCGAAAVLVASDDLGLAPGGGLLVWVVCHVAALLAVAAGHRSGD